MKLEGNSSNLCSVCDSRFSMFDTFHSSNRLFLGQLMSVLDMEQLTKISSALSCGVGNNKKLPSGNSVGQLASLISGLAGRNSAADAANQQQDQQQSLNDAVIDRQQHPQRRQYTSTGRNFCNFCNKEVCNKYFLRTHMLKMHNIVIDENKPVIANIDTTEKERLGSGFHPFSFFRFI